MDENELAKTTRVPEAWKHELYRFLRFSVVGLGNTVIDFGVYFILTRYVGLFYLVANMGSWFIAVGFSFVVNKHWTFKSKSRDALGKQYSKFFIVSFVALVLALGLLYIFVDIFELPDLFGKVLTIGVVVFWNYFANKFWTFSDVRHATPRN